MSVAAAPLALVRAARFYESSIGKKTVMAATGLVLFGFVFGHMAGNLQFYLGRDALNGYSAKLHDLGPLLWLVRGFLLACVLAHIVSAAQLWSMNREARPTGYRKLSATTSSLASRTMLYSGPMLALFVAYHLYHLTLGPHLLHDPATGYPLAYDNVVRGFGDPIASTLYLVAMAFLGMHLYHGVWSMFQSVGVSHPRYTPLLRRLALTATVIIVAGNISIPLAVLAGFHQLK
jgi:succinate dehydrogenase / fumarate reductase cytochrome b subunit